MPPDSWKQETKDEYISVLPKNYRSFRTIRSSSKAFHVICPDNVIRAFRYADISSRPLVGSVQINNQRIRGTAVAYGNYDFFERREIIGNPEIEFDPKYKMLQHYLQLMEDPEYYYEEAATRLGISVKDYKQMRQIGSD